MKKAKRYEEYKCPYGKSVALKVSMKGFDNGKTVTASYCKNNCSLYKDKCKLFKAK